MTTQNVPTCFILVLSEQVIHGHFPASDRVCDLQFKRKSPHQPCISPLPLMNLKHCYLTLIELNETLWSFIQVTAPPPLLFEVLFMWLPPHLSAHHHGLVPNYWKLCESRGGRPGLSVLTSLLVSVDVKLYWTVLRHWSQLVPNMSTDIRGH